MSRTRIIGLAAALLVFVAGSAMAQTVEQVGRAIYFDTNLSVPPGMACATCHDPAAGFAGPDSDINATQVAYPGAISNRAGNRKPPTAAYGDFSPVMFYDAVEGLVVGGQFWDGRATGWTLGSPLAEQALGPFLNPLEQNMPNKLSVLNAIARSDYAADFEAVWGVSLTAIDGNVDAYYDMVGLSIAAFEASQEFNMFTSKYDYYLQGIVDLTADEAAGLALFEGAAQCNLCHISELGPNGELPLFTDFTYDNLGIPANYDLPFYTQHKRFNPEGMAWWDRGLGGFLATVPSVPLYDGDMALLAEENLGKFKVPTLRNVDHRPSPDFVKAYGHNGFFKSLKEITNFYNTRDVAAWPAPEYAATMNVDELGNLGLTDQEEDLVVLFMQTLSDGYVPPAVAKAAPESRVQFSRVFNRDPGQPQTFRFVLPADSNVRLEVFNIRGQRVAELENGYVGAGEHQRTLGVDRLSAGVYLARLVTDTEIKTAKFTFVK